MTGTSMHLLNSRFLGSPAGLRFRRLPTRPVPRVMRRRTGPGSHDMDQPRYWDGMPAMLLGMTLAPDRTDTATSFPALASSEAISAAEFPIPITSIDRPMSSAGRLYSVLWRTAPV